MKRIDGDETIEFIAFNYDGEGGSLAICDNQVYAYSLEETNDILLGKNSQEKEYELYH
ncbi:MAG: hypothetical protein K6G79_08455 [Bacteroidales bacterium]|nr:hypothetical protein [Bacteroidales bacterium]